MKILRYLLLLCMGMLLLTGCSMPTITTKEVGKYVKAKKANGSYGNNISKELGTAIEDYVINRIDSVAQVYTALGLDIEGDTSYSQWAQGLTSSYTEDMKKLSFNKVIENFKGELAKIPQWQIYNSTDNAVGSEFKQAFITSNSVQVDLGSYCAAGIAKYIAADLNNGSDATNTGANIQFDGTINTDATAISEVDSALTLAGAYECKVNLVLTPSGKDPFVGSGSRSTNIISRSGDWHNSGDSYGLPIDISYEPNSTKGCWSLKLNKGWKDSYFSSTKTYVAIESDLVAYRDNEDGTKTKLTGSDAFEELTKNNPYGKWTYGDEWVNTHLYRYSAPGGFTVSSGDENEFKWLQLNDYINVNIDSSIRRDSSRSANKNYKVKIGSISFSDCGRPDGLDWTNIQTPVGSGSSFDIYVLVKLKFTGLDDDNYEHEAQHPYIFKGCTKSQDYSMLSSKNRAKKAYTLATYVAGVKYSVKEVCKAIHAIEDMPVVLLSPGNQALTKATIKDDRALKALVESDASKAVKDKVQLSKLSADQNLDLKLYPLTDGNGNLMKIKILENEVDWDSIDTVTDGLDFYVGDCRIGTFYIRSLPKDIEASYMIQALTAEGDGNMSTDIRYGQIMRLYNTTSDENFALWGLYDIDFVNAISAVPTDNYNYKLDLSSSGMVYNIFDNVNPVHFISAPKNGESFGASAASSFPPDVVQFYNADNIVITNYIHRYDNGHSSTSKVEAPMRMNFAHTVINGNKNESLKAIKTALQCYTSSPFLLNSYLEALYCPGIYDMRSGMRDEKFLCLGRMLVFTDKLVKDKQTGILPEDAQINIMLPDKNTSMKQTSISASQLLQPDMHIENGTEYLSILKQSADDEIDNTTTPGLYKATYLTSGKFNTGGKDRDLRPTLITLAANEKTYVNTPGGYETPRLLVYGTNTAVRSTAFAQYLKGDEFKKWKTWLNKYGYDNYLGNIDDLESMVTDIVSQLSETYHVDLDELADSTKIVVSDDELENLELWVKGVDDSKSYSTVLVVVRVIGIILMAYGLLMLIFYILDIKVFPESDGLLKKITFNRMRSVTHMEKAEKAAMMEKNEKGTYTTRLVSMRDVILVVFIIWVIGVTLLSGVIYSMIDSILNTSQGLTDITNDYIGK